MAAPLGCGHARGGPNEKGGLPYTGTAGRRCLARIRKVIAKHKCELPPIALTISGPLSPESSPYKDTPSIKDTETGALFDLYKRGVGPAGDFLRALMYLYGVEDFVSFVKQHLVDYMAPDGNYAETINPADPPAREADGNCYYHWPPEDKTSKEPIVQGFGEPSAPSGISIKMVREVSGVLTYYVTCEVYTPYNSYNPPYPSNLWMTENAFKFATTNTISSADEMLLDNISL